MGFFKLKRLFFACGLLGIAFALEAGAMIDKESAPPTTLPLSKPAVKLQINHEYGKLPLSFEANRGQTAPEVKFLSRGPGYGLFLTPTEAVLTLSKPVNAEAQLPNPNLAEGRKPGPASMDQAHTGPKNPSVTLRIKLIGANPNPDITGTEELPGKVNYLRGKDPKQWRTNVPTYGKVKYAQVYPGIDLVYYGNPRQLEHDFVVAPGADPSAIAMQLSGAEKTSIDAKGDLVLAMQGGEIRLHKPVVYQEVDGRRRDVAGAYVLKDGQRLGFQVGEYDTTRPLLIDPVLVYSTYLGGSGVDRGYGIAVDSSGNAYVTGETYSADFPGTSGSPIQPTKNGSRDAFVAKINAAGTAIVYATYLGGSGANGQFGNAITVDSSGNAYVTGTTGPTTFPISDSAIQPSYGGGPYDAFVAKINADGDVLVYSTFLGGSLDDYGEGIAADATGNAYVTGYTGSGYNGSTTFPVTSDAIQSTINGRSDAFVAKINAAGTALVYSTYLGGGVAGSAGYADEWGRSIAVDSAGNAFVTGLTRSTDFPGASASLVQPSLAGLQDAFVAKLNSDGTAIIYATYLGGIDTDDGYSIAVDTTGNAYVTGYTQSANFTGTSSSLIQPNYGGSDGLGDAFVAKINPEGTALVYSTYLGGGSYQEAQIMMGQDIGYGIAADATGNAYVTGYTGSTTFPVTDDAIQPSYGGPIPVPCDPWDPGCFPVSPADGFVAKINAAGTALVFSTYLGGSDYDQAQGIAVDTAGNAYVTGATRSTNFPGAGSSLLQSNLSGAEDAFVTKISIVEPPAILNFTATPTSGTAPVIGVPVAFAVTVADPNKVESVEWDFDGDGTVDETTTTLTTQFTYTTAGSYIVKVTVIDTDGGQAPATTEVTVQSPAQAISTANTLVEQLPLSGSGSSGQKISLTSKLDAVAEYINQGNIPAACSTLVAVVNQVNALVRSGRLSAESAAPLLGEVQAIQRSLGCL